MSADRYEITDNNASIRCQKPGKGPLILYACDRDSSTQKIIAVIRQLRADLAAVSAERDRLRDDNAALLAANRDCKDHFDALKGDYDEAAHFARHFIRDDPNITPRGAIIRLGDKCTDDAIERAIAAAPPVPTVEVTSELCLRVNRRWMREPGITDEDCGREMIAAVQSELGPALGMTAWREPTEEECERIYSFWISAEGCIGRTPGERMGRIMFAAVREVMGGGE